MGIGTYLFGTIILALFVLIVRYLYKNRKNNGCDGNCSNCSSHCKKD